MKILYITHNTPIVQFIYFIRVEETKTVLRMKENIYLHIYFRYLAVTLLMLRNKCRF